MMVQVHSEVELSAIPVIIRRRASADIYTILLFQQNVTEDKLCPTDNATYLVKERQCINNQNLFNGNLHYKLEVYSSQSPIQNAYL